MGNSGIFNKANKSKILTENSTVAERFSLALMEYKLATTTDGEDGTAINYLQGNKSTNSTSTINPPKYIQLDTENTEPETYLILIDNVLPDGTYGRGTEYRKDQYLTEKVSETIGNVTYDYLLSYYDSKSTQTKLMYISSTGASKILTPNNKDDEANDNLLLTKVNGNKQGYYGKKVSGYTANGISDWKIFYSDEDNVYLITADYAHIGKVMPNIPTSLSSTGIVACKNEYNIYFPNSPNMTEHTFQYSYMPYVSGETLNLDDIPWFEFYASAHPESTYTMKDSAQRARMLVDTSLWSSFVNNDMALDAIASPTINMYVASWNTVYPDMKIYCNKLGGASDNTTGYNISNYSEPNDRNWRIGSFNGGSYMFSQFQDGENMYFPHTSTKSNCYGYWLSSPGSMDDYALLTVQYDGSVTGAEETNSLGFALRPVVRLKSGLITNSTLDDDEIVIENPETTGD